MTAWLAEGMGSQVFDALRSFDERTRWGTEQHPDFESWGMDAGTQNAIAWAEMMAPAGGDHGGEQPAT